MLVEVREEWQHEAIRFSRLSILSGLSLQNAAHTARVVVQRRCRITCGLYKHVCFGSRDSPVTEISHHRGDGNGGKVALCKTIPDKDNVIDLVLVLQFDEIKPRKFNMEMRRLKSVPSRCQDDNPLTLAQLHRWPMDCTRDRASSFRRPRYYFCLRSST